MQLATQIYAGMVHQKRLVRSFMGCFFALITYKQFS